ncbi:low molecular weight protein-tyrosine-phosphatase [Montanilutibacter psychrotolerans]|uniref:protein-tyrosine-phosphatase n=1 Tax=Montanilutibacter psychrotolerans TaxID=1327343 RepID=A0A3M8SRR3_9GAMM|nr:low molecular weight protein-tyrosine-phosphatase [Lysobacter psychrotolerans]RNF83375.1 low molecular weight phosphotyrosine protein phosphatase [Lysobacter psychrotolerans]
MRLLVVCLGNICRSPMAEGVLRARIAASPLAGRVEVDSAGTGDWHVGHAPDPRAVAMAARHHVDISGQRARQFGVVDAGQHDWLLCADTTNLRDVRARLPHQDRARAALLLDWCDGSVAGAEVPDPYTGGEPEFEYAWRLLDTAAQAAVQRLLQLPVSRWRS